MSLREIKPPLPGTLVETAAPLANTKLDKEELVAILRRLWALSENTLTCHLQLGACYELLKSLCTGGTLTETLKSSVDRVSASDTGTPIHSLRTLRYYGRLTRQYLSARQQPGSTGLIWMMDHAGQLSEDLKRANIKSAADLLRPPRRNVPKPSAPLRPLYAQWCADFQALRRRICALDARELGLFIAQLDGYIRKLQQTNDETKQA